MAKCKKDIVVLSYGLLLFFSGCDSGEERQAHENVSIKDINIEPYKRDWMELGYGMFIHFGPNTLQGIGWGEGDFPAHQVHFPELSTDQWADIAAEAGMNYAVLTAKHHDGFCMWDSEFTEYCTRNTPDKTDIVEEFVKSFREKGLKIGLYYSLWDRHFPEYENDSIYNRYMKNQIRELLTNYGDITELWFDGAWDKDHPTRSWQFDSAWVDDSESGLLKGERWDWKGLYEMIHEIQPDCMVFNNSSSDRPGSIRYMPVDGRTAEHFDFVYRETIVPVRQDPVFYEKNGKGVFLPIEFCTSLNPDWFHTGKEYLLHPSANTIAGWYVRAREMNGNLLLNVGPDKRGLIPEYHRKFLKLAARQIEKMNSTINKLPE